MNPEISVILPIQEHDCLPDTLKALALQQGVAHHEYEIIIVDSLQALEWSEVIEQAQRQFPALDLHFLPLSKSGSRARQLNAGISAARAKLLLLLADDFIPNPTVLSLHLQAHRQTRDQKLVAMGPGIFRKDASRTEFMKWMEDSGSLFGVPFTRKDLVRLPDHFFYMANTSLNRSLLAQAGPFDEDFPYDAMDDFEMGLRLRAAGMRTTYLPGAIAIHEHLVGFQERCRSMEKAGESAAIFDAKHSNPGPWHTLVNGRKPPHSARRKESREQRFQRVLNEHFRTGYKSKVAKTPAR